MITVYREDGATAFRHMGTVSHGTLRPEDLVPAFLGVIRDIAPPRATLIEREWRAVVANPAHEESSDLIDHLDNVLNELAPPGVYFGALEGDGSDFGFWPGEGFDEAQAPLRRSNPSTRTLDRLEIHLHEDSSWLNIASCKSHADGHTSWGMGLTPDTAIARAVARCVGSLDMPEQSFIEECTARNAPSLSDKIPGARMGDWANDA